MIEATPFKREHMEVLLALPNNERERHLYKDFNYDYLETQKATYTLVDTETKKVVAVCGVIPYWKDRAEGWILFGDDVQKHLFGIHRVVKSFLNNYPSKRIEAAVPMDQRSWKWIKSLGFRCEAPKMKHYWPNGQDFALFARIK